MLTTILAGIVMVGVLVVVHEAGHMLVAKWFGVEVPVFSVGMGPRLWGFVWRGTDYRLSALPIGGYVQMAGADPFGEEDADTWCPPERSFMHKPVWQRLLVMAAGPAANLALPFLLLTGVMMLGEPRADTAVGRLLPNRLAADVGVQEGDVLLRAGGVDLESWSDFDYAAMAYLESDMPLTARRGEQRYEVLVPAGTFRLDHTGQLDTRAFGARWERLSARVGVDDPASPAARAGLQTGDAIVEVDGVAVRSWAELDEALRPGVAHDLLVKRGKRTEEGATVTDHEVTLEPAVWSSPNEALAHSWGIVPVEVFIGDVMEDGAAADAGILANDRLLRIDGQTVWSWTDVEDLVRATVDEMGPDAQPRAMKVEIVREGRVLELAFTPRIQRDLRGADVVFKPLMGIYRYQDAYVEGGETQIYYSPTKAMHRAWQEGGAIFSGTMKMLGNVLTGATTLKESVGGPVAIFHIASRSAEYGIFSFVRLMAQISFSLGIVNLLPVPVLDGGQILFYSIEGLRGRPLPLELREKVQMVGVLAMAALLLTVTVVDLSRLFDG